MPQGQLSLHAETPQHLSTLSAASHTRYQPGAGSFSSFRVIGGDPAPDVLPEALEAGLSWTCGWRGARPRRLTAGASRVTAYAHVPLQPAPRRVRCSRVVERRRSEP